MSPGAPLPGARGRPCPTPRGQAGQPRERLKIGGGPSPLLFHQGGGRGASHLLSPSRPKPYGGRAVRSPLTCTCTSLFPTVFLQFPPEAWGWDLGAGPQGIHDSPPLWPDMILDSPVFSTTSASLKPECQGLLPSNRRWGEGPTLILGGR